ncbi:hypothetical protein CJ030_MR3G019052 [Morella rubra]|uniref:Uncharacterized protein n=1 Tax=Morella rubra TaxID=262757 RepID=A0A6A1W7L9_9ROSI|nr:hypothetical protein CJ030_MR3G019052 [Morella rubra]
MATILKSLSFFLVLLLLNSALFESEARPLLADKPRSAIHKEVEIFFDGLEIKGIKTGGPSAGGHDHGTPNARNLEVVTNSGPGSGDGH